MPLQWEVVRERYEADPQVRQHGSSRTLEVTEVAETHLAVSTRLWTKRLEREHLEQAVRLIEEGRLTTHPGHFAEEFRSAVADVRGTSVAHVLKDLGHLDQG